jgi:transposase
LDNAKFHRKEILNEMAEEYGCILIFLPTYSPDLNPIEKVWGNLKRYLRNHSKEYKTIQRAIQSFFE